MFQTNTAREIFYIFLWLGGIIFLYALVFTFFLEPNTKKDKHTLQTINNISNVEKEKTPVNKMIVHTSTKVAKPTTVTKAPKAIKIKQTVITKHVEQKPTVTPTMKKVETKETVTPEVIVKKEQTISTPAVPQTPKSVTVPERTIAIPSIPDVPTVPTNTTTKVSPTKTQKIVPEQKIEKKEITKATVALEKELSRDEKMQLIEKARQIVIDEAEKARNETLKAIER